MFSVFTLNMTSLGYPRRLKADHNTASLKNGDKYNYNPSKKSGDQPTGYLKTYCMIVIMYMIYIRSKQSLLGNKKIYIVTSPLVFWKFAVLICIGNAHYLLIGLE
jgi:hypothetical protein